MTCEDTVNNGYRGIKIRTGESFRYSNKEVIYLLPCRHGGVIQMAGG